MDYLRVKIKKIYKDNLDYRFNSDNAILSENNRYIIHKDCKLCRYYRHKSCSKNCPFYKFSNFTAVSGCVNWINKLLNSLPSFNCHGDEVSWYTNYDKQARQQLKELRKKAKKLIEWVD